MCNCITELQDPALYTHPKARPISRVELPTALIWDKTANRCYAKTVSVARVFVEGKQRPEAFTLEHSYCPFCGEKKDPDPDPAPHRLRCYIAGPITGIAEAAYKAAFAQAKQEVHQLGFEPVSPLDLPHAHEDTWSAYIREDLSALLSCQKIYVLDGWETSRGAQLEILVAQNLRLERFNQVSFEQYPKVLLTPNA